MTKTRWIPFRWIIALYCFSVAACQNQPSAEDAVQRIEVKDPNDVASIVRNPVSANKPTDTSTVAKIKFEHTEYDFGKVSEGTIVNHSYKFTNIGTVPLVIADVRSTCGCTVPEWTKEPILPNASDEIKVQFKTQGKENEQDKPVTIFANTYPNATEVRLKGFVTKAKATPRKTNAKPKKRKRK
ncbi:MAG: DUF1573 domain-containing protein [Saprospiraceae bacterium]|nr:DUF1573 domain-containing protein [Saprospiraceae bacterium]MBP7679669.1 DUF1573 domain-containing protein [Saprospiraceae bacterium]